MGLPALRLPPERGEGPGHLLSHTRVSQVLQKNPAFLKLNVTHKRTRYRVSQHGHCTQFKEEARLPRPVKTRDSRGRARQGRQAASSWSFCTAPVPRRRAPSARTVPRRRAPSARPRAPLARPRHRPGLSALRPPGRRGGGAGGAGAGAGAGRLREASYPLAEVMRTVSAGSLSKQIAIVTA